MCAELIYHNRVLQCLTYLFVQSENLNFMKTAKIAVYGNITVFIKYFAVCLKIDYTLRCLEYTFVQYLHNYNATGSRCARIYTRKPCSLAYI